MEWNKEENKICHNREGSLDLTSKCLKKKEEEGKVAKEERLRKLRNCLMYGGSIGE